MYTDFYGLNELPFKLTPDPRFLYLSPGHQEALAQMTYGVNMRRGFVVTTGEVGTGKTTLIRTLLKQLDASTKVAYLYHAILGAKGLFQSICRDFQIPFTGRETKTQLIFALQEFLISVHQSGGNAVLIVDEAQNLKPHILEEIRLISNLENVSDKLIQLLLVGQPEFGKILDRNEIRQLKQRIALRFHLSRLNRRETEEYISHRLSIAGYNLSQPIFSSAAVDEIYAYTYGIPRAINILCDNALIMGYSIDAKYITPEIVKKVEFEDIYQEMELAKKTYTDQIEVKAYPPENGYLEIAATQSYNFLSENFNGNSEHDSQNNGSLFRKFINKLTFFRKKQIHTSVQHS